jgi:microcystin degradation protein MlrC
VFRCHRYPHTDLFDRGHEIVQWLPALKDGSIVPVGHVERLPMILPATTTDEGIAAEVLVRCEMVAARLGLVDCTFFHGFMHADVPTTGASVLAYSNDDLDLARTGAREVAEWIWHRRAQFYRRVPDAAEAVARATAAPPGLIILHEMSDNPGGGAPGDGTHLLRAMLGARLSSACFAVIADAEAAAAAHSVGEGASIALSVGGNTDPLYGEPISGEAYVASLADGRFTLRTPMGAGREVDLGPSACVRINEVDVIIVSRRAQVFDPAVLELHGIHIAGYRYLALKSEHHFRAGFAGMWSQAIPVDGPGLSSVNFDRFPRQHSPRPIYPIDRTARYVA